jgi:hypothetical protein
MSGVFRNIDTPPPHRPASVYPPAFGAGGGRTRWVERWWGVNSSEDARHCSVLYICKYFVPVRVHLRAPPPRDTAGQEAEGGRGGTAWEGGNS